MRAMWLVGLAAACGGAVAPAPGPAAPPVVRHPAADEPPPVDAIAFLAAQGGAPACNRSVAFPRAVQLDLTSARVDTAVASPVDACVFDRQGDLVRVAIHADHAALAVWTPRASLLPLLARDQHVSRWPGADGLAGDTEVLLRAGAAVRRLAREKGHTRVRYLGTVEIEGWVPDDALVDTLAGGDRVGRPPGPQSLMVAPGAAIRSETQWSARALAVVANGYFVEQIAQVDDAWYEARYEDIDVLVHGFLSRRDPPERVHRWRDDAIAAVPFAPNATAKRGTCLYSHADGDPIGFVTSDAQVQLDPATRGWSALAIDTPLGPLALWAQTSAAGELGTCGPPTAP
jgi:hypothetical protein